MEGMYAVVVQETAGNKQPESFDELYHLRMVNHRNVQHSVIRYSIGSLTVAGTTAYADGHHLAVYHVAVDAELHLVFHTVEKHDEE